MYYGRYGRSAEDPLLFPVFIGYPDLVRGYDYGSFDSSECAVTADGSCPVIDRLIAWDQGNRLSEPPNGARR